MKSNQNYINHIALVLDASGSMNHLRDQVVKVADNQIQYLATRSKELDQETRITVYTFADTAQCVIYDKDVLRLPSIRAYYRTLGMTALIDATIRSQDDLALTATIYGDHAFLTYVLTDGMENVSRNRPEVLAKRLATLPDNWTVAVLVPDQVGKHEAKKFGFPADNIAIWDATSTQGLNEAADRIKVATDQFMTNRSLGIRGSRSLFSTGVDAVNANTITTLSPAHPSNYVLVPVMHDGPIKEWVENCGYRYQVGKAYYQLMKTESIQPQKSVAVVEKATSKVFVGPDARRIVGLPDMEVRVKPEYNPAYDIFIQSTSVNRKLIAGTKLLLFVA